MTPVVNTKRFGHTEGVDWSYDQKPTDRATDFSFGANAPQDTQDSQDSHDEQDMHGSSKNPIRVQSPALEIFDEDGYPNDAIDAATLLKCPLPVYVWKVLQHHARLDTVLEYPEWRSPMFGFARFCKAHPSIMYLSDYEAMQAVEDVMLGWDDLPAASDPWAYYFPQVDDAEAARSDFMASWHAVRDIPFHSLLDDAIRLATAMPLEPPLKRGDRYQRFISIAGWLQTLRGSKTILLPTRTLDSILGCDHSEVSRLRRFAERDGLLTITKPHTFRPGGRGEATEFRFAVERFKVLRGES